MQARLFIACLLLWGMVGCGSWVGNPGGGGSGILTTGDTMTLKKGEVVTEKMVVSSESGLTKKIETTSRMLLDAAGTMANIEMSLVNEQGRELFYQRASSDNLSFTVESLAAGAYQLFVKNNSDQTLQVKKTSTLVKANERTEAIYKDYTLKSFVVFARTCQDTDSSGNSVSHRAPDNYYYVQPFVFFGKVDGSGKVTSLKADLVQIKYGDSVINLSRLDDLAVSLYKELGASDADNLNYTRAFYSGYFGAAGQMYTTEIFRFGGNCSTATTFNLGTDVGKADVRLVIKYQSSEVNIDESIAIRPTLSSAFSVYESDGNKLQDYTQCTYNRNTGEPMTYNGSATECKQFSLSDQPYIKLDYKLPSQLQPTTISDLSDPTRVIFYGHSYPQIWYKTLLAHSSALVSGAETQVELPGCLNNGGITSTPLSVDKTVLPLNELNVSTGDVINLAYRTGSYTNLTKFYQGNIDYSQTLTYPACVPSSTESCVGIGSLQVTLKSCQFKADSGVFVGGVMDSFVYPSYFLMSGVVKP